MRRTITFAAFLAAAPLGLLNSSPSGAESAMQISPSDTRPATPGPAQTFTGEVRVTPLFDPSGSRHAGAAEVSFTPCARTAWHSHPGGQTLIVTAGSGWVQQWGGDRQQIHPGDVVWTPPGVKHWHGGGEHTAMTHIAMQEPVAGDVVEWLEHVSDEQYFG